MTEKVSREIRTTEYLFPVAFEVRPSRNNKLPLILTQQASEMIFSRAFLLVLLFLVLSFFGLFSLPRNDYRHADIQNVGDVKERMQELCDRAIEYNRTAPGVRNQYAVYACHDNRGILKRRCGYLKDRELGHAMLWENVIRESKRREDAWLGQKMHKEGLKFEESWYASFIFKESQTVFEEAAAAARERELKREGRLANLWNLVNTCIALIALAVAVHERHWQMNAGIVDSGWHVVPTDAVAVELPQKGEHNV